MLSGAWWKKQEWEDSPQVFTKVLVMATKSSMSEVQVDNGLAPSYFKEPMSVRVCMCACVHMIRYMWEICLHFGSAQMKGNHLLPKYSQEACLPNTKVIMFVSFSQCGLDQVIRVWHFVHNVLLHEYWYFSNVDFRVYSSWLLRLWCHLQFCAWLTCPCLFSPLFRSFLSSGLGHLRLDATIF